MARTVTAAAVYTRISNDHEGSGLGVARQEQDCRALAEQLGWPVAEVYEDNDISAYSGKQRPAYRRMLEDVADRRRDAVLIYHPDRLTRQPRELEQFVDVLTAAKATLKFVAGDADITTGDGLMHLRIMAAFAAKESADKSRRIKRKGRERAERGLPVQSGKNRPFGYADDRVTIREDEAAVVRELAARFLAGESWLSLAQWTQDNNIPTPTGGPWKSSRLRTMLISPRIAGLREYNGQVIGAAVWPGIITVEDRDRMLALIDQRKTTGKRTPRRHLLSGLLRCALCGERLYSATREGRRLYTCNRTADQRGCGRIKITAEPVEHLIARAVLMRLSSPELAAAMAGRAADDSRAAVLADQLTADQAQLDELAVLYANRQITGPEWVKARQVIENRRNNAQRQLAQLTHADALNSLNLTDPDLAGQFHRLPLSRQSAVVAAVLSHANVKPATPGIKRVDPARVEAVWRI